LSKLGSLKKIDETVFQTECIGVLTQLWAMTDRTIRTALLSALKHLVELIPASVVNSSLFDNMIAGFSDSNAKYVVTFLFEFFYVFLLTTDDVSCAAGGGGCGGV
jgi:hypothetical protein